MTQICGEMAQIYGALEKRLKNVENDLEIWEMAKIFGKWPRNGLSKWDTALVFDEAALLCWKCLKNLTNGLNMWEMTYIFGRWLKYLRNLIIWAK